MEKDFYSDALLRLDGIASKVDAIDGGSHDFSRVAKNMGSAVGPEVQELCSDYGQLNELDEFDELFFSATLAV